MGECEDDEVGPADVLPVEDRHRVAEGVVLAVAVAVGQRVGLKDTLSVEQTLEVGDREEEGEELCETLGVLLPHKEVDALGEGVEVGDTLSVDERHKDGVPEVLAVTVDERHKDGVPEVLAVPVDVGQREGLEDCVSVEAALPVSVTLPLPEAEAVEE